MGNITNLSALAERINQQHRLVVEALKKTLGHAKMAGELLVEAKSLVSHGQWGRWLQENCPGISDRTARNYMRIAKNFEGLPEGVVGVREAIAYLSEPKTATVSDLSKVAKPWDEDERFKWRCAEWPDYWKMNVYLMMALGLRPVEVAEKTGVTLAQVRRAIAPEFPFRWQDRGQDTFCLYRCLECPEEFMTLYEQFVRSVAYRWGANALRMAVLNAERNFPSVVDVLRGQLLAAEQRQALYEDSDAGALLWCKWGSDGFLHGVVEMAMEDARYAVGDVAVSEVDSHPVEVFYVFEKMNDWEDARAIA